LEIVLVLILHFAQRILSLSISCHTAKSVVEHFPKVESTFQN